jgi:putative hydrolase of HD superfamily
MAVAAMSDVAAVLDLARLVLDFGRVDRITYHPDGVTPESDTDHTVMLALIGCALAERHFPELDRGRIAMHALAHDLPEVYAGDTPTLHAPSAELRRAKRDREDDAFWRIYEMFHRSLPWVPAIMNEYEMQVDPEARYVRALDKLLPKLTHLLNDGTTLTGHAMTHDKLAERLRLQRAEMLDYAAGFPPLFRLFDELAERVLALLAQREAGVV